MKVLAIGGAGFIGQAVIDALPRRASVTVFDLEEPGRDDVSFVQGSIEDRSLVEQVMEGQEIVLHFAAMLGVVACQRDEAAVNRLNVEATRGVLEAAAKHGVERLVFSSSSEIYGDGRRPEFCESDPPSPKTPYGRSKVRGEELVREFAETQGIMSTVVRFFNVYGPRQRSDFVVGRFCQNAAVGAPIELHGDGGQTRTFTFVEDAARATVGVMLNPHKSGRQFEIYNVSSRETATVRHVAERILAISASSSPIVRRSFEDAEVGRQPALEIRRRVADISKLVDATGYAPLVGLDEGLRRTFHWYKSRAAARPPVRGVALAAAPRPPAQAASGE